MIKRLLLNPLRQTGPEPSFWLLVAVTVTGTLAMHIFVPALPAAARDLGSTATAIQLTVSLYLIGLGFGQLIYGPLSDRFGRRPATVVSLALYTLGLALAIPASNIGWLVAARILQSFGAGGALVLGRAMVRDGSSSTDAVRRLSLLAIAMTATPTLAPALGGLITSTLGWRAIFVVLALAVGALFALVVLNLPETNRNPAPLPSLGSILTGYARLLGQQSYMGYVVAGACCTTSAYAFLSSAPFLFVDILHRSPDEVGLYCLIIIAGMAVGAVLARQLVSKLDIKTAARLGAAVCVAGAVALLIVDLVHALSVATIVAPMILYSVGMGLTSPNAVAGLMNAVPRAVGAGSSFYGFTQMAFGALFTAIVAFWHDGSALPVACTLLFGAALAQIALLRV